MGDKKSNKIFLYSKSGEKVSFEFLYRFFFPKLEYFANQYLFDSEASKNIVQDVFVELWDRRVRFDNDTNIQSWLFTVTKNKSLKLINHLRSKNNYLTYIKSRQLNINYKSLADFDTSDLVFEELQEKIESSLEKLPPVCRKVFEMSRFEEKKNREIADELGINIKTVEAHISKALKRLKADLKDYLPLIYLLYLFDK